MLLGFVLFALPPLSLLSLLVYGPVYFHNRKIYGRRPFSRHLCLYLLIGELLSLLYLTIFWYGWDITFAPPYHFLNLHPFIWVTETYDMGVLAMARQLAANVGMFVPLGLLLPMVFASCRRWWKTGLFTLTVTLSIETFQYFIGRSADIDDVIMNLAGGLLGYGLFTLGRRCLGRARWWKNALDLR